MTENNVADSLVAGLVQGIHRLGEERGLAPLDWRVIVVDEVPVVEGAPLPGSGEEVCATWAKALCMQEYSFDEGDGSRSWYLIDDIWEIEISTLSHAA
jgi:hypothetical protein